MQKRIVLLLFTTFLYLTTTRGFASSSIQTKQNIAQTIAIAYSSQKEFLTDLLLHSEVYTEGTNMEGYITDDEIKNIIKNLLKNSLENRLSQKLYQSELNLETIQHVLTSDRQRRFQRAIADKMRDLYHTTFKSSIQEGNPLPDLENIILTDIEHRLLKVGGLNHAATLWQAFKDPARVSPGFNELKEQELLQFTQKSLALAVRQVHSDPSTVILLADSHATLEMVGFHQLAAMAAIEAQQDLQPQLTLALRLRLDSSILGETFKGA